MYQDGNTTNDAIGAGPEISGGHYMAGHTAAFSNGPWYIARVQQEAPEVFEATQLDYFYTENYDNIMLSGLLSGLSAANTDDPARREAVITFMKWMTAPANIKRVSEAAGSTLAVVADIDTSKNRLQAQVYDLINNADYICEPFALHFEADVVAEFGQALAAMAQGAISEEEFVAQVAAVID